MIPTVQGQHRHRASSIPHWPGETSASWASLSLLRQGLQWPEQCPLGLPQTQDAHIPSRQSRQNASKLDKQTSSPLPLTAHLFIHVCRCFIKCTYREGRKEKPSVTASCRKRKKRQQNRTKQNRGVEGNRSWAGKASSGAALGIQIR